MRRLIPLLAAFGLLWALPSWGQPSTAGTPPSCSVAELDAGTCAPARQGTRVRIRNSDSTFDLDCTDGTGANAIICVYDGTNWVAAPDEKFDANGAVVLGSTDYSTVVPSRDSRADFKGIPRYFAWEDAAGADGSGNHSEAIMDDSPALEWTAVDAHTVDSGENTIVYHGNASLKLVMTSSGLETGDGVNNPLTAGNLDFSNLDYLAMWMLCDTTTTAGDWQIYIKDSVAAAEYVDIPAIDTANMWHQFSDIDLSGIANASKDDVGDFGFRLSAAGATAMLGATCYFDILAVYGTYVDMNKNIAGGGEIVTIGMVTAEGQPNTPEVFKQGVDHYFLHYDGSDTYYVPLTDQTTYSIWGLAVSQE